MATKSVIVIEDNLDSLKLMQWLLDDAGMPCRAFTSAEAGLEAVLAEPCDLILLDIELPGMDGKQLCRKIRANPEFAHLPIIAVTAHCSEQEHNEILSAGVNSIFTKPLEEAGFLDCIQSYFPEECYE